MQYSIRVAKHRPKPESKVNEAEYQHFAEQFVDMILDSSQPWLFQHFVDGGFQQIPTWEDLNSGEFALDLLIVKREGGALWEPEFANALINEDRHKLIPWFKKDATKRKLTGDEMARLLGMGKASVLRKSLKGLEATFKFRRGAKPKLPVGQYYRVSAMAEILRPAILKLLNELNSETSHTVSEILQYLRKDHPEACEFLLRHVSRLHQALNDPKLLRRAAKRVEARSRVLANAMAGSDYELSFSTSLDRSRF